MQGYSIMLIDDDRPTNIFNEIMVKRSELFSEWYIYSAADKALDALVNNEVDPDIILLDINMPCMDGWQFLSEYDKLEIENKVNSIYMLTTSKNRLDIEKAKTFVKVKGFKEKPLTVDMLKKLLPHEPSQV